MRYVMYNQPNKTFFPSGKNKDISSLNVLIKQTKIFLFQI